ncbi:MAG: hypothetical protein MZU84_03995 [Sphingobacterium sp.]|nr:hypothetical protein [Sphingobacterium sp.]
MTSRTPNHAASRAWRFRLRNACVAACVAAVAATAATLVVYQRQPGLRLGMDRSLPSGVTGFYPLERQGKTTFAWSGGRARVTVDRIDRRAPWTCRAEVINWRPPTAGPARLRIRSGGALLVDRQVGEPTAALEFTIPAEPARSGIDIDIDVSPTFRPGPQDPRELGLAFDAITCEPARGFAPRPAASVLLRGSAAAAIVGAAVGLTGLPALAAAGASLAVAAGQAWSLGSGGAAYSLASPPVFLLAGLFALFCLLPVVLAAGVVAQAAERGCAAGCRHFGVRLLPEAHLPAPPRQGHRRRGLPCASARLGAGGPVLLHAALHERDALSVRDRPLCVLRAVVAADNRPRHAAANRRLRGRGDSRACCCTR